MSFWRNRTEKVKFHTPQILLQWTL